MNATPGIKKAIDSAWEKLPEILIAAVAALCVFGFGIWIDCRDVKHDIASILAEQEPDRLCQRIGACNSSSNTSYSLYELRAQMSGVQQKLEERGLRISNLEQQLYELKSSPKSRPDPFTGTMGRELEARIQALEGKRP